MFRRQVCGSRNSGGNAVRRTETGGICSWRVGFGFGGEKARRAMLWRFVFRGGCGGTGEVVVVFRGKGVLKVLRGGVVGEVMKSLKSSWSMSDFWWRCWYFGFGGVGGGGGVLER